MCVDITAHDLLAAKSKQNKIKLHRHFVMQLKCLESTSNKMLATKELRMLNFQRFTLSELHIFSDVLQKAKKQNVTCSFTSTVFLDHFKTNNTYDQNLFRRNHEQKSNHRSSFLPSAWHLLCDQSCSWYVTYFVTSVWADTHWTPSHNEEPSAWLLFCTQFLPREFQPTSFEKEGQIQHFTVTDTTSDTCRICPQS